MRILLLPLALLGCTAPSTPQTAEETLMQQIESIVVLPKGAASLDRYGRNYTKMPNGHVLGVYVFPPESADPNKACSVMTANFSSRPCTKSENDEIRQNDLRAIAAQARAGERRWFADWRTLPGETDGGCTVIIVEYEPAAKRLLRADCNGEA